jgi:hypothetical protein
MIFSLPKSLEKTFQKVYLNSKPVAYSWGNEDALNKWLIAMNKKQIDRVLELDQKGKYPLIWLVEGAKAIEVTAGYKFEKVAFWISSNSKVETLNENRDLSVQYQIANELISKLSLVLKISEKSISWTEKTNVSTNKESQQVDIWDSVILTMDLIINKNCLRKLYI